jgi:hypothetical protein
MAKQELQGERNWYAVHTYAGYENAVMRNLKQRIESLGMQDKIFNVVVPTEKKIKIKGGKRAEVEEKVMWIRLPSAQRTKITVIDSLFLPNLFLIVNFEIPAKNKKIIGMKTIVDLPDYAERAALSGVTQ